MTLYLTSSPTLGWAGDLNPANGLLEGLRASLSHPIRCVMITSYPDNKEITDRMAWELRECFDHANLSFDHYEVLDRRTQYEAERMVAEANFIILCGGHVPTENAFFRDIHLRELLRGFDGVMLTISAGSMNCAGTVYAPPELEGEAVDPNYVTHLEGLGLTDINILPHFQSLKDCRVDGIHLVKSIVSAHSYRHPVYCLPDGSYFIITPKRTELRGLSYRMHNGKLKQVCADGECKVLSKNGTLRKVAKKLLSILKI